MKVNWLLALATLVVAALTGSASVVRAERYTLTDGVVSHRFASAGCDTCGAPADCGCNTGCNDGCDDGCDDGCRDCGWGCDEPWRLFPEGPCGFTLTGFINGGTMLNADSPASRFNGPLTFPDRDELMLNQLYAIAEKKVDTTDYAYDIGGRLDLLFGTDYFFTQATGLETTQTGAPKWNNRRFYGLAMPQAYGEIGLYDLSVKVGHFYAPVGYQGVMATSNFFYTQPYTFQYGEPFTLTGALATWKYTDRLSFIGGLHNGWDIFDRNTERMGGISGFNWVNEEGDIALSAGVTAGDELNSQGIYSNRTLVHAVGTFNLTERLQYVLHYDTAWQKDNFAPGQDAEWYGLNHYMFYTINDCWKAGTRFEWFRDDDGVRVTGVRPTNPINGASFVGDFYEISTGLNWKPSANLTVRPEIRYDWFDGVGLPYDDGQEDDQLTAGMDAILLW